MAIDDTTFETDDDALPRALKAFIRRRTLEMIGVVLLIGLLFAALSLTSWNINDPSLNNATGRTARNWLGFPGAVTADLLMQFFGLASIVFVAVPVAWVIRLFSHETPVRPKTSILLWLLGVIACAMLLGTLPAVRSWPLQTGLGGNFGDVLAGNFTAILAVALRSHVASIACFAVAAGATAWCLAKATGLTTIGTGDGLRRFIRLCFGWLARAALGLARLMSGIFRHRPRLKMPNVFSKSSAQASADEDIITRLAPRRDGRKIRVEPALDANARPRGPQLTLPNMDIPVAEEDLDDMVEDDGEDEDEDEEEAAPARKKPAAKAKTPRTGKKSTFELPELEFLSEPKKIGKSPELSKDALEENARALEVVLDDFGVKGQIINVRPGPVVTLYELEPAPGIKSSRVISLADDIARSMSAVSARVAVVPGRNAIGIELPNTKRETVYLRELLGSNHYAASSQSLCLALGKNIGGEPIYADLARMPHLLIAGTTGSGKSVGINTMILSLLYRLTPERCRLIMIDPKMLELSVYEGIPHLLAPVVTDPRKAVVALKWAVREMEDRYKKMSKVGVRNVDGYNERVEQMLAKGQKLTRTVQTGFDAETGQPIFEQEEMDTNTMPYIVVIIDEMADLMMVAGKDIEGAVQRLAQMARAAGIHVVMATQRPSVDVITGTIKANFPTRISFQVTSKIDSRTILGEMGAEQLLGQGDMLYMAGGGRISRLHAPFVSDSEVETIVNHLKSQAAPEYVEAVTEEQDDDFGGEGGLPGEGGGSGDSLYDQAVAVVLRDKKVSTSYIQRRLQIGYNKAASLIERMEQEGLISASNATGKREILVPGDSARD